MHLMPKVPFGGKKKKNHALRRRGQRSASGLLGRIFYCMFARLLQSAKLVLLKRLIQGQGNDFQPKTQFFWWQKKIESRYHRCLLTLSKSRPSSNSPLVPGMGSLVGS